MDVWEVNTLILYHKTVSNKKNKTKNKYSLQLKKFILYACKLSKDLQSESVVGIVSSDCPSSQELLRQQLASRAAGWDRPASSLRLQGPFIRLSLATNITVCNLSPPIPRIHVNLISLKYYSHSP